MTPAPATTDAGSAPPAAEIDVAIEAPAWISGESGAWNADESAFETFLERAVEAALRSVEVPLEATAISALFTDDERMRALNARHRGVEKATNVLSWPAYALDAPLSAEALRSIAMNDAAADGRVFLGDLALGFETVAAEAAAAEKPLEDHAAHLIVHGVLHLLGFSHEMDEDAVVMERRETRALASLGVADPYSNGSTP